MDILGPRIFATFCRNIEVPCYLELQPGHLFLSSNFLLQLLNETSDYTRPAFIYLISIHKSTSYFGVVPSRTLLDVSLSVFHRFKLKRNSIKHSSLHCLYHHQELLEIMTALDVYLRLGVYSRSGIYFCYDSVYPPATNRDQAFIRYQ